MNRRAQRGQKEPTAERYCAALLSRPSDECVRMREVLVVLRLEAAVANSRWQKAGLEYRVKIRRDQSSPEP